MTSGGSGAGDPRPLVVAAALLVAFIVGGLLALVGAFLVPLRVGGVPVPVSPLLAAVGNLALGLVAARWAASRAGSLAAAAGWLLVVGAASMEGPGGDLVVPAGPTAYAFLVLGALSSATAVGLGGLLSAGGRAPAGRAPRQ